MLDRRRAVMGRGRSPLSTAAGLVGFAIASVLILSVNLPSAFATSASAGTESGDGPGGSRPAGQGAITLAGAGAGAGAGTGAGAGAAGFGGDGGPATEARLDAPGALARDPAGDLFIADAGNCRVREVAARAGASYGRSLRAGSIVTVVGGPCTGPRAAPEPSALTLDPAGDLFVAFGSAGRVAELPARSGNELGTEVKAGRLAWVAGSGGNGFGGDGGPASRALLDHPSGLAVDPAGDLLISDSADCRLRLVAATDGTRFGVPVLRGHIYTVAGNGICGSAGDGGAAVDAQLWDPDAIAVDPAGDVIVADQGNRSIRELAAVAGTFYGVGIEANHLGTIVGQGTYSPYVADGLPALGQVSEMNSPSGLALGPGGNLYIADGAMHAIRLVPAETTTLLGRHVQAGDMYTVAGALPAGRSDQRTRWVQTPLAYPVGLVLSGGRIIYSDRDGNVVRELPAGT